MSALVNSLEPVYENCESRMLRLADAARSGRYSIEPLSSAWLVRRPSVTGSTAMTASSSSTLPSHVALAISYSGTTRERPYSKVAGSTSELSIKLVLDTLYACYFNLHADELQAAKDEISRYSEPGRVSSSVVLREDGGGT